MVNIGFALSVGSTIPWATKLAFAEEVEKLGYDSFWLPHFIARDVHAFDTLDSHCAIAARTSRIKLGTGVFQIPLCQPVDLARRVVTLDHVSNGRFIFGIGTGFVPAEYEMQGVPFENRGKRADEMLEVLKKLWTEDEVVFKGEYYTVKGFPRDTYCLEPKPIQKPHPPLLWGGGFWRPEKRWHEEAGIRSGWSQRILRRIAKYCDGWAPDLDSVDGDILAEGMVRIKELAKKEFGRTITDDKFDISANSYASINIDNDPKRALEEAKRFYATRERKGFYLVQGNPPFELLQQRGCFGPADQVAERISPWLSWDKKVPAFKRVYIMFASLDPIEQLRRFHAQVAPLLK